MTDKYIKVTQDGIGRISYQDTSSQIVGLYTHGMCTCFAVILRGEKGIVLIHNTSRISRDTILRELEWVGSLVQCCIAFRTKNPPALKNVVGFLQLMKDELPHKGVTRFEVNNIEGSVGISRDDGRVFMPEDFQHDMLLPPLKEEERDQANYLKNAFQPEVRGDLQFDGFTLVEMSKD